MKSYKDIDKEIILNAPEGAMWYNHGNSMYYTYNGKGVVYLDHSGKWSNNSAWFDLSKITGEPDAGDLIPLPNIEIPWEATADSVCPVPDGIYGQAQYKCEEGMDEYYNPTMELGRCNSEWSLVGSGSTSIISYKIIDEDYLMGVVTVPQELVDHCKSLVEGVKVDLEQPLPNPEDQLIDKLKFLQNLANQFPEIREHAVKYMKEWLDYYVEDCIEGGE